MMMTMDPPSSNSGFGDFGVYSSDPFTSNQSTSPPLGDPDVDWSVFENAERYLLRDDSAWITRLSKDFWWNLERISEMITSEVNLAQQMNQNGNNNRPPQPTQHKYNQQQQQHFMQQAATKNFSQLAQPTAPPPPMQFAGVPPRKIVGQRSQPPGNNQYRTNSMFNNGFASPPPSSSSSSSSSGSTIVRPPNNSNNMHSYNNNNNIPEKSNFFQAFSSMSITGGNSNEQDMEYNPFQSKISFDNNMWGNNAQQPIPWQ